MKSNCLLKLLQFGEYLTGFPVSYMRPCLVSQLELNSRDFSVGSQSKG